MMEEERGLIQEQNQSGLPSLNCLFLPALPILYGLAQSCGIHAIYNTHFIRYPLYCRTVLLFFPDRIASLRAEGGEGNYSRVNTPTPQPILPLLLQPILSSSEAKTIPIGIGCVTTRRDLFTPTTGVAMEGRKEGRKEGLRGVVSLILLLGGSSLLRYVACCVDG